MTVIHMQGGHGTDLSTMVQDINAICGVWEEYRDKPKLRFTYDERLVTCKNCLRSLAADTEVHPSLEEHQQRQSLEAAVVADATTYKEEQ